MLETLKNILKIFDEKYLKAIAPNQNDKPVMCETEMMYVFFSASQIFDLADGKTNTMELAEAIDNSDLEAFGFTDDFIFELWGAITDAKSGRGKTINNNHF